MRSDVKHLAKCGRESLHYCQISRKTCAKIWMECPYKSKPKNSTHVYVHDYVKLKIKYAKLRKVLYRECPEKYPDNCTVCKGENLGVRGNENIIDGKAVCDYCDVEIAKKKRN